MKSPNEMGPARRMRSRRRSARSDGGTGLGLYFRSEVPPASRPHARGRPASLLVSLRVAPAPPSHARGLLRRRLDLGGAIPRGLEGRRGGRRALRERLPLERTSARRLARGRPVAAAALDPDLPLARGRAGLRRRGRPASPAPRDPLAFRDTRPLGERALRLPAPGKEPRSPPRDADDGEELGRRAPPGGGQGPCAPLARRNRLADGVGRARRVDLGFLPRAVVRGTRGE